MIKDYQNMHEMVLDTVTAKRSEPAYRMFTSPDQIASVTWGEFYDDSKKLAKSLMALDLKPDEKVNIISYTCYEWVVADVGTTFAGGVTVGIYQSNPPRECEYIINHSEAVIIFVENDLQLQKVLEVKDNLKNVRKVVMFRGEHKGDDWVISWNEFMELGKDITDEQVEERATSRKPEDDAAYVYTSGTTGVPKGAMLSHGNMTFTAQSAMGCFTFAERDEQFLFLPLAHVFARVCVLFSLCSGVPVTFARSIETVIDDIGVAKPTFFASVPRIYEKIFTKVVSQAEAAGGVKLKIFNWARGIGDQVSAMKLAGQQPSGLLAIKYAIAKKLVFSKLHDRLGGRVRFCISGAAPLNAAIAKFFHAADILVVEGLGMTENTSFSHCNRLDDFRFGWVGKPGPGIEARIGDNQELQIKGPNVMKGYFKMEEQTKETFTDDGWLRTGDQGEIDSTGFLRITGRIKDLIITAGGKNIAPSKIEGLMITSKYIGQCAVYGDRQKFLVAAISVDPDNIKEYAAENGIPSDDPDEIIKHDKVRELIDREVAEKNKELVSVETIKKVLVVPEFTIERGTLTPSMKVKKNKVWEKHEKELLALWPSS